MLGHDLADELNTSGSSLIGQGVKAKQPLEPADSEVSNLLEDHLEKQDQDYLLVKWREGHTPKGRHNTQVMCTTWVKSKVSGVLC